MGALENRKREELGGGTGGIRERKECVMGVLKKFSHVSLFTFFFSYFSCASISFFPN